MKRQFLKDLGLAEEDIEKIMAENGRDIRAEQSRAAGRDAELLAARHTIEQLQEASKQYEGVDVQGLQKQLSDTQKNYEAELRKVRLNHAVEKALSEQKAINPAAVTPFLSGFLEKAELLENGTVRGLREEVEKLSKTEGTSFLFQSGAGHAAPVVSGASPAGSVTAAPGAGPSGYEARLAEARRTGNAALAVAIKREAAAEGIGLM